MNRFEAFLLGAVVGAVSLFVIALSATGPNPHRTTFDDLISRVIPGETIQVQSSAKITMPDMSTGWLICARSVKDDENQPTVVVSRKEYAVGYYTKLSPTLLAPIQIINTTEPAPSTPKQ